MAVTAKNASKCKNHWYQPSLQTSIDTLVPVADLISPNLRSSGFPGKPGQEFSPKIAYFWRSKMFLQDCIVGLGYKNTASHVCMIENFKFNHVFCNNFCNNWAKIRQCAVRTFSINGRPKRPSLLFCEKIFLSTPMWILGSSPDYPENSIGIICLHAMETVFSKTWKTKKFTPTKYKLETHLDFQSCKWIDDLSWLFWMVQTRT